MPSVRPTTKPFAILHLLSQAWHNLYGCKKTIWIGLLTMLIVNNILKFSLSLGYNWLLPTHQPGAQSGIPLHLVITLQLVSALILAPIVTGIIVSCIAYTRREIVTFTRVFSFFPNILSLSSTLFIITLLANLASIACLLTFNFTQIHNAWMPLISIFLFPYLVYSLFVLSLPLVALQAHSPLSALMKSAKMMFKNGRIFKLTLVYWAIVFLFLLSLAPLFIGLSHHYTLLSLAGVITTGLCCIWIIPLIFQINAQTYLTLTRD